MFYGLQIDTIEPTTTPATDAEASPEDLRARAQVCRLLVGVFAEEPSMEFLRVMRSAETVGCLAEAGLSFDQDFTETELTALADALACEYATLFAASGGFPPVESVRLTGRYQQEPCFTVRQEYRRLGFAVKKGRFFVFDDHLAVELTFIAELLERAAAALEAGNTAECRRLERETKRFWTLHLGRWVRGYARLVQRAAEHSFYREMARLLEASAEQEIALLRLRVDDQDQGREVVPKSEVQVAFNPDEPVCNACPGSR